MGVQQLWRQFNTHLLQRRLPHGLINWRFLLPYTSSKVRKHRTLWWHRGDAWPRPIWVLTELVLWLRWISWYSWIATWRVVRVHGPRCAAQHALPIYKQFGRTLGLSLGWCIHPFDIYRFGLILSPEHALDFVYDVQTYAFHRSRNPDPTRAPASYPCIQDKIALAKRLEPLGIPVVQTVQIIARDSDTPLNEVITKSCSTPLFFKTRSGNQGRGAFAIWHTPNGLEGQCFDGTALNSHSALKTAWSLLVGMDDVLVQPLLTNHADLAAMSLSGEAITVRYISQLESATNVCCLSATLEVPAGKTPQNKTCYSIFLINEGDGQLRRFPEQTLHTEEIKQTADQIWALAPTDQLLPYWPELVAASHQAHSAFQDVRSIAWDWVITPSGPILLEGNVGWGTATPQLLLGGFLADENT